MKTELTLAGRVALITGATTCLGHSQTLALVSLGAKVAINTFNNSRDTSNFSKRSSETNLEKTHIERCVVAMGGEVITHNTDLTCIDDVENMVKETINKWGKIDILINNAGTLDDTLFLKSEFKDFKCDIDSYLMGSVNCTKAVWGLMLKQHYGRIVMTMPADKQNSIHQDIYSTAKLAALDFMESLCMAGMNHNIRINTLIPPVSATIEEIDKPNSFLNNDVLTLCSDDAPNCIILCANKEGHPLKQSKDAAYL